MRTHLPIGTQAARTQGTTISSNLRDLRGASGLSQAALAQKTGLDVQAIIRLESGVIYTHDPEELAAIADAFGLYTDELYNPLETRILMNAAQGSLKIARRVTGSAPGFV